jgi:NAD(P)-dependent dehydrogenase (short-subunit alcohol dehydrogenase family)
VDLQLAGRSALITGGSRGIGLAVARRLAAEGCSPIHLVARDRERLAHAAAAIGAEFAAKVVTHAVDLQTTGACDELAEIVPNLDILINNAGSIPRGTLLDVDEATWRAGWDGKVFGYINLTRAVYRKMRERKHGTIVNIVGAAGENPNAEYIAAGSGNAALIYFTEALGSTSLADGIRVLGVNPGPTLTDRYLAGAKQRALKRLGSADRFAETFANLPLQRPADSDEIASLVAYLASDLAGYISGTLVRVDGGLSIKRNIG